MCYTMISFVWVYGIGVDWSVVMFSEIVGGCL